MSEKKTVEVCSFSYESTKVAQDCGASRVELCGGRGEGGTTPSQGLIKSCVENLTIPVRVMIRPRGGDCLYSDSEFEVMKADIEAIKPLKPEGFVFGILLPDATVDMPRMKILMEMVKGFKVTFHRAFDMVKNQEEELKKLIELNITTVLTSGGKNSVYDGMDILKKLTQVADNKIEIMAGAGITIDNVKEIASTGVGAIHLTAKSTYKSKMEYQNKSLSLSGGDYDNEYLNVETDPKKLSDVIQKLAEN